MRSSDFAAYSEVYIYSRALFSGARRRVVLWLTDVSGERTASIFRAEREIETSNQLEAIHFWA
jgi:hypothetical protein